MSDADPIVETDTILLERVTMAQMMQLSPQLVQHSRLRVFEEVARSLVVQLYAYVLAHKQLTEDTEVPFAGTVEVAFPRTFRQRLALIFGRRRTVTAGVHGSVTVTASHFNTFPEGTFAYPDSLGAAVPLTQLRGSPSYLAPDGE